MAFPAGITAHNSGSTVQPKGRRIGFRIDGAGHVASGPAPAEQSRRKVLDMDKPSIPPRPTYYRGILMRSRLEVTVAEWLDARMVKWEYEPARHSGPGGTYLPDFRLPFVHIEGKPQVLHLEVKPLILAKQPPGKWVGPLLKSMEWIWQAEPQARLAVTSPHDDTYWRVPITWQSPGGWKLIDGLWVRCERCEWAGIENYRAWEGAFYMGGSEPWRCPDCRRSGFDPISPWASPQYNRYLGRRDGGDG